MKILFLDIDGVCNTYFHIRQFGMDCIADEFLLRLKNIINQTGTEIVLSSTWRILEKDRKLVRAALGRFGMDFIDVTDKDRGNEYRSAQIKRWLDLHPTIEKYAILDDDSFAGFGMRESFFQTEFETGLTDEITEKIINHLKD